MLFVTTRNDQNAVTANHALRDNRCSEGGFYLPMRHPVFSEEEIGALMQQSFGTCVSEVLNRLLGSHLNGWDVDFSLGRHWARLEELPHKIFIAEPWHTPGYRFEAIVKTLAAKLDVSITDWVNIAIRAAVLFGLFSELKRRGYAGADVAVLSGDFSMPMAAWYARRWGLPIGNVVCCCNENNTLWDLLVQGQLRTDTISIQTTLPEADVTVPEDLERLIWECGGLPETTKYLEAVRKGRTYYPSDAALAKLRRGMFVSVVSSQRLESTISGVFRSHGYSMTPAAALTYAGLLDCRAKMGQAPPVIIWSEESPEN